MDQSSAGVRHAAGICDVRTGSEPGGRDAFDLPAVPLERRPAAELERELLSLVGWAASVPGPTRHDRAACLLIASLDENLFLSEPHRRIVRAMRGLAEQCSRFGWLDVLDALARESAVDARDAVAALPQVVTRDYFWPAEAPQLHAELVRRRDVRARWAAAVQVLETIAGRPVRVEVAA